MKSTKEYKDLEKKYYMQVVNRMAPVLVSGKGTVVTDNDGNDEMNRVTGGWVPAQMFKKFMQKAKDKNDSFRLMGFGHRVYKNYDPRAKIIKAAADKFLKSLGVDDPLLQIAKELEENALKDKYFIDRKLFPNVDFYSGVIYRAMGIPPDMYTVMFVLGRLPGWIAQWREMRLMNEPIGRPRQLYTGPAPRKFKSKK